MMFVDGFILKQGFGFLGIFSATSKQIFSIIFFFCYFFDFDEAEIYNSA